MHLIWKPLSRPPMTACPDTHLCCEWSSYGTHTTFPLPYSASQCFSLLTNLEICLESPCLSYVLGSSVWGNLSLASYSQIQSLTFSIWIFALFWKHTGMSYQARICRETPFPIECIYLDKCNTSAPNVSLNLWYLTWCASYGTDSSTHAHLDLFVATA